MADGRSINVTLTADTTQYVRAMNKARRATTRLYWRNSGIYPIAATSFLLGVIAGVIPSLI